MQKTDWSTGVEEPDHGKDAAVLVARLQDPRLYEDAVHVLLDGGFGDVSLGVRSSKQVGLDGVGSSVPSRRIPRGDLRGPWRVRRRRSSGRLGGVYPGGVERCAG
jgi:hypothetical protein